MGKRIVTESFRCGNCLTGCLVTHAGKQFIYCPVLSAYRNLSDRFIPERCIGRATFSIQPSVVKLSVSERI